MGFGVGVRHGFGVGGKLCVASGGGKLGLSSSARRAVDRLAAQLVAERESGGRDKWGVENSAWWLTAEIHKCYNCQLLPNNSKSNI